ncbi:FAD-dependent oxidoreductase [Oceanicoccus sagamiensis]|uniref:Glycerol-3-phosphate dehydrogenase n=1 Tax=Oceanicoccus sagamiensis TaxID=716816 RepID=A0A1X9NE70_9GAMM|nr:FAD-dependent oxidoreductase [Oceanicoccus sagamiensis]ARN73849.1 glycerol-3-phosphate dehydrogenase [Oceanicoccus sagamiensis]
MTTDTATVDIAIIGGGIAGLWLLNRLCNDGYNAILFEQGDLGGAQTIASQGMIHGGIKYALGGALTGASEAIADMPDHWRRCLEGKGDVDLQQAQVLSEHFYMWSTQSITSKVTSFFASKLTRGRVDDVSKAERPAVFQDNAFKGNLYKLVDLVLDVPSVVAALRDNYQGRIFSIDWQHSEFSQKADGSVDTLVASDGENSVTLSANQFVFTAGEGNEQLCSLLSINKPAMQRRPLKQVLVKHHYPHSLYAHCMGGNPSPRLTISSHATEDGKNVWYLGGDLATEGVALDDDALIEKAKDELNDLFPWLDFNGSEWAVLYVDRAEPKQKGLIKPDKAFAETAKSCSNVIISWPTKLTLAPNMTDEVCDILKQQNVSASHGEIPAAFNDFKKPAIGTPCWETLFK